MELTVSQATHMLIRACDAIIDHVDLLTKADQNVGDGDHGMGMKRGFSAAKKAIEELAEPETVGDVFKAGGQAILAESGGASGVIFALLLRSGFKSLGQTLTADGFADWLSTAADTIATRGKAKPGDKTMLDALIPASEAARSATADGLAAVTAAAYQGARDGVEATKDMVAAFGKAKALGERSLGFPDPGAISTSLILGAMRDYVAEN